MHRFDGLPDPSHGDWYVLHTKSRQEKPLFPGYLFLRGSLDQAYVADRTKRVSNILKVHNQERMTWQLTNLSLALSHSVPLDPYPYLKEGVLVEVKAGAFRGLQGLIERRTGWERLILQVDLLGQAVSLEL